MRGGCRDWLLGDCFVTFMITVLFLVVGSLCIVAFVHIVISIVKSISTLVGVLLRVALCFPLFVFKLLGVVLGIFKWLRARMSSSRIDLNSGMRSTFSSQSAMDLGSPILSPDSQVPSVGASAGGSFGAFGIPRPQFPMPPPELIFGSSLEGAIPVDSLPGDEERATSNFRRPPVGRRANHSDGQSSGTRSRFSWENWMVTSLLEAKKSEWDEQESLVGRAQMLTSDAKWSKVQDYMRGKNVFADIHQLKYKWDNLLGQYKKIKDHQHKSGNPQFETMTRSERRAQGLAVEFSQAWMDLLDSFYGGNATINPPCMAEGFETDPSDEERNSQTPGDPESETAVHSECTAKSNSGKRRKSAKAKPVIADCISNLSDRFIEVEDRKQKWLEENAKVVNETERERRLPSRGKESKP